MIAGDLDESRDWREWVLRAIAGTPPSLQIRYGPAGERRLTEQELLWLPGYEGSTPVRIGNGASGRFQPDVYLEVLDVFQQARRLGLATHENGWRNAKSIPDSSKTPGTSPMRGFGKCAGGAGTSPIRTGLHCFSVSIHAPVAALF
jgi:GH15 family glucan-1,4-alpha-glucosidase